VHLRADAVTAPDFRIDVSIAEKMSEAQARVVVQAGLNDWLARCRLASLAAT
jgi:hypothetical protein